MLNSWKKSTLPMPKRMQDLDLSIEFEEQVGSASKSVKTLTLGSKIVARPMRTADFLKYFELDSSPAVNKARKQLWSVSKSGSKKHNEQIKITANKENVRKTIFPKTSSRRTTTVKTNPADQTLPLIDMEDLEKNPRKLKQSLRIPQSSVNNKTTTNPSGKRQTMYQTKLVRPAVKPGSGTKINSVYNPAKPVGQSKLKRQTVHQTGYALKSIPEISITKYNDSQDKSLSETVHESESESVRDVLKQILGRMDKLEMLIRENHRCSKCHRVISPCKHENTKKPAQENVKENNTVDFVENIAQCNEKIVANIVTDTTESIKQTTNNVTEKVMDNAVSEIKNNIKNIEDVAHKLPENVEKDTKYNIKNCVQNLFPLFSCNIEEVSTYDLNAENNLNNNETLQNENRIKPMELIEEKDTDLCTNLTLRNATLENTLHKSHFELLEDQLQNNSLASLAFFDSDDSGSPVYQEIDYAYLLGGRDGDVTEINTNIRATTNSISSTGSNDAIRTYNEMRKCMPMLCTPKISRNNNASLMTPSVQNSHKKILSRRIQEQLLMLNK